MSRRTVERDLVVLMSFAPPGPKTNPYITMLARALADLPGTRVRYFDWRTALVGRYDVLHVHWPEVRLAGRDRVRRFVNRVLFAMLLLRLQVLPAAIVRTVHNVAPHEQPGRVDRALLGWLDRRTTGWIGLNDTTPLPGPVTRTILHGHYVDWFGDHDIPSAIPGRILFAGLIREYKNVPGLIAAFGEVTDPTWSLSVVGSCSSPELEEAISAVAAMDDRVTVSFGYVADETLAREVGSAELVALPYSEMHNSGAALMALSIGRPVLVPETEQTRQLATEVGERWVQRFDGRLSGKALCAAVGAARGIEAGSRPVLDGRDWKGAAGAHRDLYLASIARRRGNRGRRGSTDRSSSGIAGMPISGGDSRP